MDESVFRTLCNVGERNAFYPMYVAYNTPPA